MGACTSTSTTFYEVVSVSELVVVVIHVQFSLFHLSMAILELPLLVELSFF